MPTPGKSAEHLSTSKTQSSPSFLGGDTVLILRLSNQVVWLYKDFPGCTSGKEPACQCGRLKRQRFNPCTGKRRPK